MNNGSKKNELWLCSIYDLIYKHNLPDHIIAEIYKGEIDSKYLIENLPVWRKHVYKSYERLYDASKRTDVNMFNQWLAQ